MGLDDRAEKYLGLQRIIAISSGINQDFTHAMCLLSNIAEQRNLKRTSLIIAFFVPRHICDQFGLVSRSQAAIFAETAFN